GLLEVENLRLSVHQGQHADAEGVLHLRVAVEAVEHHPRVGVPAQLDDDAHAGPVRLVPEVRDAVHLLVAVELGDLLDKVRLVDQVRDLGDDDALAPVGQLFDAGLGPDPDAPAPGRVGLLDPLPAQDDGARWEVRPLHDLHEVLKVRVGVVDQKHKAVHDLPQVVGRDVGGHPDGDAGGAVDEQVGNPGGQHRRLLQRVVEVGDEIDGVLVDVPQHLHGQLREAGFRVAHGRRRVAVYGAEVAVAVHQRVAEVEVLGHAHHGVVDGGVAVGVVFTHDVADDARRLAVLPVGPQAQLVHAVENPPLDRLEPVPHVRQGPVHDDAHRVIDIGSLHLLVHTDGENAFLAEVDGHARVSLRCPPGARRPGSGLPGHGPG